MDGRGGSSARGCHSSLVDSVSWTDGREEALSEDSILENIALGDGTTILPLRGTG